MNRILFLIFVLLFTVPTLAEEQKEPNVKVYGPRSVMDTSPIMVVPDGEEPRAMTAEELAAMAEIPLEKRLAKYDLLAGDARRAGGFTPYFNGQILGAHERNAGHFSGFLPFIWEPQDAGATRWQWQDHSGYGHPNNLLRLQGSDSDGPSWSSREIPITPGGIYRFSVFAACSQPDGELCTGTDFLSLRVRDMRPMRDAPDNDLISRMRSRQLRTSCIFLAPPDRDHFCAHLGPGKPGAQYEVSRVQIDPVLPIYRGISSDQPKDVKILAGESSFVGIPGGEPRNTQNRGGDFLRLGDGEKIELNRYTFDGTFGRNGCFHRPLEHITARFETDRIVFEQNTEVVYRFQLQPITVTEEPLAPPPPAACFSKCTFSLDWADADDAQISVAFSTDGEHWTEETRAIPTKTDKSMSVDFDAENAHFLYVRIRNAAAGTFSVTRTALTAATDTTLYEGTGETIFAIKSQGDQDAYSNKKTPEEHISFPLMFTGKDYALYILKINETGVPANGIGGGGIMDYFGTEDDLGMHADGPGKWTFMAIGGQWGPLPPHSARIDITIYNWLRGCVYLGNAYAHYWLSYELMTPEGQEKFEARNRENTQNAWEKHAAPKDETQPATQRAASKFVQVPTIPPGEQPEYATEYGDALPSEVPVELKPAKEIFLPTMRNRKYEGNRCGTAFSPDGKFFAISHSLANKIFIEVYDLAANESIFTVTSARPKTQPKMTTVEAPPVAFSPDARFLAYVSFDGVCVWDVQSRTRHTLLADLPEEGEEESPAVVQKLHFTEDGKTLRAEIGTTGYAWPVDGGEARIFGAPRREEAFREKYTPARNEMYATVIRDAATGQELCTLPLTAEMTAATFVPGTATVITVVSNTRKNYGQHPIPGFIRSHLYPPQAKQVNPPVLPQPEATLIEFWDTGRLVWDMHQGNMFPTKTRAYWFGKKEDVSQITVSPDGRWMYLGLKEWQNENRENTNYRAGYVVEVNTATQ